jgi:hypothetical protein
VIIRPATLRPIGADPIAASIAYGPELEGPDDRAIREILEPILGNRPFYLATAYDEDEWVALDGDTDEELATISFEPVRGDEPTREICSMCALERDRALGLEVDRTAYNRALLFGCTCSPAAEANAIAYLDAYTR